VFFQGDWMCQVHPQRDPAGEPRDFKFGTLTYHSKSNPADETIFLDRGVVRVTWPVLEFDWHVCDSRASCRCLLFRCRRRKLHCSYRQGVRTVASSASWRELSLVQQCLYCDLSYSIKRDLCLTRPQSAHLKLNIIYMVGQKARPQTHGHNSINSKSIYKIVSLEEFVAKFAVKWLLKSHHSLHMLLHYLVKH